MRIFDSQCIKHRFFLNLAALEARHGAKNKEGGAFGCVIVKSGKMIVSAHNTVLSSKCAVNHAEINAIRLASKTLKQWDLSDCEMYTTTEPCAMCAAAIHWAKIRKVYFATTIKEAKKVGFNELDAKITRSILKDKLVKLDSRRCTKLLQNYRGQKY